MLQIIGRTILFCNLVGLLFCEIMGEKFFYLQSQLGLILTRELTKIGTN